MNTNVPNPFRQKPYCVRVDVMGSLKLNKEQTEEVAVMLADKLKRKILDINFTDISIHINYPGFNVSYLFTNKSDKQDIQDIILK